VAQFNPGELKISAFIIGALEVLWGIGMLYNPHGRLSALLELWGVREIFAVMLLLAGLLLVCGSAFPCRTVRHAGLILTPMITFPTFGFAVDNNMINVFALSLPFLGAMALLIMFMDSRGKPRAKVPR
jgi:hypothetical protein